MVCGEEYNLLKQIVSESETNAIALSNIAKTMENLLAAYLLNEDSHKNYKLAVKDINGLLCKIDATIDHRHKSIDFLNFSNLYTIGDYTRIIKGDAFSKESHLQEFVSNMLSILTEEGICGIATYRNQYRTNYGIVDLFVETEKENIIIELKRGTLKRLDIYQTHDYLLTLEDAFPGKLLKALVICHDVPDGDIIKLANKLGVSIYTYSVKKLLPTTVEIKHASGVESELVNSMGCCSLLLRSPFRSYISKVLINSQSFS